MTPRANEARRVRARSGRAPRIAVICGLAVLACAFVPVPALAPAAAATVFGRVVTHGGLLGLVLFQIVTALALGFALSGISFLIFFVRGRQRWNPAYRPRPGDIGRSCGWAALGISGGTV